MIIKKITIKNFRSYYGETNFQFSDGLTLIIGGNGDGKTTFFEALEWLFNTFDTQIPDKRYISAMLLSEMEVGESEEVMVSMLYEHNGEKELIKRFRFKKQNSNSIEATQAIYEGYKEEQAGRVPVNGVTLIEDTFSTVIRKYHLFKGESELNVFKDEDALKTLVSTFSGVKSLEELVDLTNYFEGRSQRAVQKALRKDRRVSREATEYQRDLDEVLEELSIKRKAYLDKEKAVKDSDRQLKSLEKYASVSEEYKTLKGRIKVQKDKVHRLRGIIELDYNTSLLDKYWILSPFPEILKEYQSKISNIEKEKRRLHEKDIEEKSIRKGELKGIKKVKKLVNDKVPLQWDLPDKQTMKEMIDDQICKVCGTEAPVGSPAYNFMVEKLNTYLLNVKNTIKASNEKEFDEPDLFINKYIEELYTRYIQLGGDTEKWLNNIPQKLYNELSFIEDRRVELGKVEKDLDELENEKNRLLIQVPGVSEELLEKRFNDLRGFYQNRSRDKKRKNELKDQIQNLEKKQQEIRNKINELAPDNPLAKLHQKVNIAFESIAAAFSNAKDKNISEFLITLEKEANRYMELLNTDDFRGIIKLYRTAADSAEINLVSLNGETIHNPGGAQETTMYMSVLFAISEITSIRREQDYPLIFDAPTSSFEDFKEDIFYNVLDGLKKQCIIVTKDLLIQDPNTNERVLDYDKISKLTSSVYHIKKDPSYDPLDLTTVKTITEFIK